jgi:hypothetical protein
MVLRRPSEPAAIIGTWNQFPGDDCYDPRVTVAEALWESEISRFADYSPRTGSSPPELNFWTVIAHGAILRPKATP